MGHVTSTLSLHIRPRIRIEECINRSEIGTFFQNRIYRLLRWGILGFGDFISREEHRLDEMFHGDLHQVQDASDFLESWLLAPESTQNGEYCFNRLGDILLAEPGCSVCPNPRTNYSMRSVTSFKIGFIGSTGEIQGSERPARCSKPTEYPKEPPFIDAYARMALAIETAGGHPESRRRKGIRPSYRLSADGRTARPEAG